jgi:thiol-disulfide isomerase/thioredoxin
VFAATREKQELIGTPAPALNLDHWVNSSPLELSDLKGRVLLVRWWTDTCELCAATAPALRKLQDEYGTKVFSGHWHFSSQTSGRLKTWNG